MFVILQCIFKVLICHLSHRKLWLPRLHESRDASLVGQYVCL